MFPLDKIELPSVIAHDLDDVPARGIRMANPTKDHASVIEHGQWRNAVRGYLASIAFADEQVGRVIDALNNGPNKDNTIVVLWTDHGWHLGEKEHWRKFALWEEATKTPLIWVSPKGVAPGLPQGVKAGTRISTPVTLLEVYPTLVELTGLPKKEGLSGVSLAPLLADPKTKWDRPALTTHGRNNHALRTAQWRYIHYEDGGEELYDHSSDPMEWKNLAGDEHYASVIADLKKHLPPVNAPDQPTTR
jgi:arylsulfatase A-like enzyme